MADTLVFDMSSMAEGTPSVFVRKDWLSILDNQNRNYQGNQSVIDTSQLANSNKYLNYREAYLTIPLLIAVTGAHNFSTTPLDYAVGMKNWYGSVIHSFTLDYNGTTIIQQTPYCGMYNTFKLMTSLSYQDLISQGQSIGFWPDTSSSIGLSATQGVVNNCISTPEPTIAVITTNLGTTTNEGLLKRSSWTNINLSAIPLTAAVSTPDPSPLGTQAYSAMVTQANFNSLWNSSISTRANGGMLISVLGVVYLKHLHSFFERVPLLKGVFMKMTINLNQPSVEFASAGGGGALTYNAGSLNPLGGVCPLMVSNVAAQLTAGNFVASLSVGQTCNGTNATAANALGSGQVGSGSILLNVPAYTFNPVFETSYLSAPIKKIVYEDIYQYQVRGVTSTFNQLITNGIANIRSVLVLPYFSAQQLTAGANVPVPFQSAFDPAGCGPTSPLVAFNNFNVQVSGQNAIYNSERYSYEQFLNQLYGQNSVNGGMTDGLTSGLVGFSDFTREYCYYYVNVGRMLPVEEAVPKSVNILGTSLSQASLDLYVFISYGVEVSIDILTGSRV